MEIRPLKSYALPGYPTRPEADANVELLRRLPQRWQGNAVLLAVLAGAGLATLGVGSAQAVEKAKIVARLAPIFSSTGDEPKLAGKIAQPTLLSEADARAIIIEEAKKAGITFTPDVLVVEKVRLPKSVAADAKPGETQQLDLTLDGTDAKRKISYEFVSTADAKAWSNVDPQNCAWDTVASATALHDGLAQKLPEGTTVVFYDAGGVDDREALRVQVRGFIAWLKAEGVI